MIVITVAVLQVSDPPYLSLVLLFVLLLLVLLLLVLLVLLVLVLLVLLLLVGVGTWIIYEAATSPSYEHKQVTLEVVTEA